MDWHRFTRLTLEPNQVPEEADMERPPALVSAKAL